MPEFLFSQQLQQVFKHHSKRFPKKELFGDFIRDILFASFSNGNLTKARRSEPTCREILEQILTFIKAKDPTFGEEFFGEDWTVMTVEELSDRYITQAPEDYVLQPRSGDPFVEDSAKMQKETVPLLNEEGPSPASLSDVELIADLFALALGDYRNDAKLHKNLQEVMELGMRDIYLPKLALHEFIAASLRYCPNSVWLNKRNPWKTTQMSFVIPIPEDDYEPFINGAIDDAEIVHTRPPCLRSKYLFVAMICGEMRLGGTVKAATSSLVMTCRQIANISPKIMGSHIRLLSVTPSPHSKKRLSNYGFFPKKLTKNGEQMLMNRTGHPIVECSLAVKDIIGKAAGSKTLVYGLVAMIQSAIGVFDTSPDSEVS